MRDGGLRALAGIGLVLALAGGHSPAAASTADRADHTRSGEPAAVIDLGTLPGAASSEAVDVNDAGTVVGDSAGRAVRWDPSGSITDLGILPGGRYSHAVAINDDGVTVGQATAADSSYHLVLWDRAGRITDLGTLSGGTYFNPMGITSDGTVFGHGDAADGRPHSARWHRRTGFTLLAPPPGSYASWISAVSDRGVAIGPAYGPDPYNHLVRWDRFGRPTNLGSLDHLWIRPAGINDSGVVVGSTWVGIGPQTTPMRWTRSHGFTQLRTPYGNGYALAVNRHGIAVGSWTSPYGDVPARWGRDGTMLTLHLPIGFALGSIQKINDSGTAAGVVEQGEGETYAQLAVRWDPNGQVTNLDTIGGQLSWPTALNEHGTTAGNAVTMDGHTHAVLWPATPNDR